MDKDKSKIKYCPFTSNGNPLYSKGYCPHPSSDGSTCPNYYEDIHSCYWCGDMYKYAKKMN